MAQTLIRLSCGLGSGLTGVSALARAVASPAMAQDAPIVREGLDEITVTAQRREENQQEVPISITTVPEDRLASILAGAEDIRALATRVPAVKAGRLPVRTVMTSPTLNEAAQYGADFVRGLKIVDTNKVALHVSGTASIDEHGGTAHVGDIEAQADRMLVNIAALLARQGADFGDVVSAITYLRHPADAGRLRERVHEAGFEGFPHALVAAPICRPELLCETEAMAVVMPG